MIKITVRPLPKFVYIALKKGDIIVSTLLSQVSYNFAAHFDQRPLLQLKRQQFIKYLSEYKKRK